MDKHEETSSTPGDDSPSDATASLTPTEESSSPLPPPAPTTPTTISSSSPRLPSPPRRALTQSLHTTPVFIRDPHLGWRPAELLLSKTWSVCKHSLRLKDDRDVRDSLFKGKNDGGRGLEAEEVKRDGVTLTPVRNLRQSYLTNGGGGSSGRGLTPRTPCPLRSHAGGGAAASPAVSWTSGDTVSIALSDYDNLTLPLQDVDDAGQFRHRNDMTDLPYLHEAGILYNLATRHNLEMPYTRAGSVIFAMNPLKWFDGLYNEARRRDYAERFVWHPTKNHFDPLPPHVYEASSLAYRGMITEGRNQAILVSGESGAGKTETVKILMSHLATFDMPFTNIPVHGQNAADGVTQLGGSGLDLPKSIENGNGGENQEEATTLKPLRNTRKGRRKSIVSTAVLLSLRRS
mmetsp:Transcript_50708/g.61163  ORF Transcript_50708/g.61163 Transcript_50708/m.61163 type:complete len:403 (+) Transcript_50708:153-1361(+)